MLRSGFELYTGISNVLIFITSMILMIKTADKKWKIFFVLIAIDSFLGSIIHTFSLSKDIVNILWYILSFFFSYTINLLLFIFISKKFNFKNVILISTLFYLILFIERLLHIEFLYTFIIYAIFVITFIFIKSLIKKNRYCILALLFQFIGGILLVARVKFFVLDYNGIYHLFMLPSLIMFYLHAKKSS